MQPFVSAIVPTTMSRRQFWPDVINSFVKQTYTGKELIFIADTAEEMVALNYLIADLAPIEETIIISGGATLGDKRNAGCRVASGSVIAHFDDDDLYSPGRIADQVKTLEQTGKALTGYMESMVHELRTVSKLSNGVWCPTSGWWQMQADYLMGGSLCYLKDWWLTHRFDSINIGEDTAFILAASTEGQSVAGKNGLDYYCIRNHHTNTSGRCVTGDCIEITTGGTWAHQ